MCLYEREVMLLGIAFFVALAQACFVVATREGRAALARTAPRSGLKYLSEAVLFTLPVAGVVKLFHDWIGSDDKSVCVSRPVYLLVCFLLCVAVELQYAASKLVETGPHELDLATRYPVRRWGLVFLLAGVSAALLSRISFK